MMQTAVSIHDLYANLASALESGTRVGVCTVVETRGSTPQRAGAKMLVFEDGRSFGTIGGGSIEADIRERAREILRSEQPELFTVHLTDDPETEGAMVCGGSMKVFIGLWRP